jgi:1-deoxy-D-xylulose-5-phosphate synthase
MGLSCTIADARFAKPLDAELIKDLSKNHELMITIEEGSSGGFGAHVLMHLAEQGILDDGFKIRNLYLPDTFIQQGDASDMYAQAGLNSENIVKTALKVFGINKSEFKVIKS